MNTRKIQYMKYWLEVAALGIILGLVVQGVRAWTDPAGTPPNGNVGAPINTSANPQTKAGNLVVGGLGVTGSALVSGNLGVGTLTPQAKLDVSGLALVGDVCLFSDRTKCLSKSIDLHAYSSSDEAYRSSQGYGNQPIYLICDAHAGAASSVSLRLTLSIVAGNSLVYTGQFFDIPVHATYTNLDLSEVTRDSGAFATNFSLNCPNQLTSDKRYYECVGGVGCPTN